ncbi:MAG: SUMF1/EgtB/PvdO family nonheme iron enzyme [Pyrinomonadaceae bacterium MAG19_C2-C3]|nr:SUMF1/EgtB/PvdO family nonheme iron enzyme [Pyrinomonadaceae bacterium MAG19_C2-C3]
MSHPVERLITSFKQTRDQTHTLFHLAPEAELHRSPGFGYRPILWHLAHIGVFEAFWILQKIKGDEPLDNRYEALFDPIKTPRENSNELPSRHEMEDFLAHVRARVTAYLETLDANAFDPHAANPLMRNGYVFDLVLEHERQHQETLAYLLHLLDPSLKTRPNEPALPFDSDDANSIEPLIEHDAMVTIPAGAVIVGATGDGFGYDNEYPAHKVELPAFQLAVYPTTNLEYLNFIEAGGYGRDEFWSDEGRAWREKENITAPLYWQKASGGFTTRTMFDSHAPLDPHHPVSGVSWYEAEAYARFAGKRLPTEAEWERAANGSTAADTSIEPHKRRFAWGDNEPDANLCNFNNHVWGTTRVDAYPRGASAFGVHDMTGNVWEWTNDAFAGYPGFEAFPYPEYSAAWFDGDHRVLKGGSWATRSSILRTSFRNFFRRGFRIAFAGIRCASDV